MSGWVICPIFCSSVIPATIERTRASSAAAAEIGAGGGSAVGASAAGWHEASNAPERQSENAIRLRRTFVATDISWDLEAIVHTEEHLTSVLLILLDERGAADWPSLIETNAGSIRRVRQVVDLEQEAEILIRASFRE